MVPDYTNLSRNFFASNAKNYDLKTQSGCGKYTEAFVLYARKLDAKIGHLKKHGGATQYNGHAIDAILYLEPDDSTGLYQAVDIIASAESSNAQANWGVDIPRYASSEWLAEPGNSDPTNVPWVAYNEGGFQKLKNMLAHDYARRPQGADFDVSVWAGRYFHNCYMGPNGKPLGENEALKRIKPELCAALNIQVDDYYGG